MARLRTLNRRRRQAPERARFRDVAWFGPEARVAAIRAKRAGLRLQALTRIRFAVPNHDTPFALYFGSMTKPGIVVVVTADRIERRRFEP